MCYGILVGNRINVVIVLETMRRRNFGCVVVLVQCGQPLGLLLQILCEYNTISCRSCHMPPRHRYHRSGKQCVSCAPEEGTLTGGESIPLSSASAAMCAFVFQVRQLYPIQLLRCK